MAVIGTYAVVLAIVGAGAGTGNAERAAPASATAPLALSAGETVGALSAVSIGLEAEGRFIEESGAKPDQAKGDAAPGRKLKVRTRTEFYDRVLAIDGEGRPIRSARLIVQATSALGGEIRPRTASIRPQRRAPDRPAAG